MLEKGKSHTQCTDISYLDMEQTERTSSLVKQKRSQFVKLMLRHYLGSLPKAGVPWEKLKTKVSHLKSIPVTPQRKARKNAHVYLYKLEIKTKTKLMQNCEGKPKFGGEL